MSCPVHGKMVGLRILSKSNKFSYRCSGISSGTVCGQMDIKVLLLLASHYRAGVSSLSD